MALLQLKDIGKIYVSDGNVAVGIRGVNLSFERGEFVAITGKSGSGKSTLLNVISGMDTYEEGELFIENQPTSHYLQPEWEDYREKYISFIFQDYNIIDSLTVLQNVELALMHIEDVKQRRARALELIGRVGLTSHIKHKGSKLSGGQKQRTVIARALAKDSPIILADEPTGNLDSRTSEEIINLLKEVSKDKLLIVVTHNFEQVEEHATRHVRIFDGAVESDTVIHAPEAKSDELPAQKADKKATKKAERKKNLKNGLILGRTIFTAKPRLSLFLCLLMIIGTLGVFLITTLSGEAATLFEPSYMFRHIDGRVIVTTQNGEIISEEQLKTLAEKYGAKTYMRIDSLLDRGSSYSYPYQGYDRYFHINPVYGKDFGAPDIGTYPTEANEVLLYLPISYQDDFGKNTLLIDEIKTQEFPLKVTGICYYYDNNITPMALFTEKGFRTATAIDYIFNRSSTSLTLTVSSGIEQMQYGIYGITTDFDIPADKIYVSEKYYKKLLEEGKTFTSELSFTAVYHNFDYYYDDEPKKMIFNRLFTDKDIVIFSADEAGNVPVMDKVIIDSDIIIDTKPGSPDYTYGASMDFLISDELLTEIAMEVLDRSYTQASLFFENDKEAHAAALALQDDGYIAVSSDTEYIPNAEDTILNMIMGLATALVWFIAILFLAFFINLCSSRALGAFKGDMAIMRSMGIPVSVIRIAMYTRMMLALIPGFVCMAMVAVLIFTSPAMNEFFVYLYAWQYAVIALGMILLTVMITRKQVRRLFGESVKKSLKGDNVQ
jgi:ABC-type lipoprotein export system ATPase subunit